MKIWKIQFYILQVFMILSVCSCSENYSYTLIKANDNLIENEGQSVALSDITDHFKASLKRLKEYATIIDERRDSDDLANKQVAEENMTLLIKSNLDALAEKYPQAIFEETGTLEYNELYGIVALGEKALPFLGLIADISENISWYPDIKIEQRLWAVQAIYAINPEIYDLSFISPDGKYTIKLPVESFESFFNYGRSYNDVQIIENFTNKIVYTTTMNKAFNIGGLFSPKLNWSTNSKFAIIDCCGRRSGSVMAIDIQAKDYICLPGKEDAINYAFPGEDIDSILTVPRCWFSFNSWVSDEIVKIEFYVSIINEDEELSGWYTYDLNQRKIIQLSMNKDEDR
ncbi:MAG: hypothetical protein ACRDBO_01325 [Lachnospiraceae bacterium]